MRLQPPDQLSTVLIWVAAIFMAIREGIAQVAIQSHRAPVIDLSGYWAFLPLALLLAAALRMALASPKHVAAPAPPPPNAGKVASLASLATPVPRRIPQMRLGDVVRYIARDSLWPANLSANTNWLVELERELIDQLSGGSLVAEGRFSSQRYAKTPNTAGLVEIDGDFWRFADVGVERYFQHPEDTNFVWSGNRGFADVRLHQQDVERIWAKQREMHPLDPLPGLEEALDAREAVRRL
jgi:hypothetical protein